MTTTDTTEAPASLRDELTSIQTHAAMLYHAVDRVLGRDLAGVRAVAAAAAGDPIVRAAVDVASSPLGPEGRAIATELLNVLAEHGHESAAIPAPEAAPGQMNGAPIAPAPADVWTPAVDVGGQGVNVDQPAPADGTA